MSMIIRKGVPYGTGDINEYSTAPIGTILAFGSDTIPDTYLLCDGASLAITAYPELYKVIGTTFGSVDAEHFNVPDLRGRFLEGTPSSGTTGTNIKAGLPNIVGTLHPVTTNRGDPTAYTASGAFSSTTHSDMSASAGTGEQRVTVFFDASKSNSIYGNSTTVQPPSTCVNYIIKAKYTATSSNPLDPNSDSDKDYLITTRAEWDALTTAQKAKYDGYLVAFIEDVNAGLVMDSEVVQGSENPVSGNAVYEAIDTVKTKGALKYKKLTFNTISGVTFSKRDNNDKGLSATRVNDMIVINFTIRVQGSYSGTSSWLPIFQWSQLNDLLNEGESLLDANIPYFCSDITYTNNASYNKLDGVMNGCYLYFYNTAVFDMGVQGQIIIPIKTS